ncbi:hypothetical protein COCC4DRAFT_127830 [Bipolaris maydis ATCC 48331]|uniref:Uncharacterized protein n=2 Tax=Cochliobolus heterostrophus TaxID=5016 RepID=M2UA71_COCH5|nr:uncharacterized protein COCC4DRAFT_127830 [Bipolaris maydis ATCC 48331]EMD90641.1 hypothetical protein COCHEDRAFT_1106791 [Bipolaris maydis C5]KAH7555568.1 hypothetical protein BM1_07191 [Bipolaris maydis]ENI09148.1 hypothetical protein COCC4DRAFT_127830 [Bipolaris maydis ATCC 48331]KAJ5023557.1 hypothetical protein J3E73DRAFT_259757 [Bipolaris maydis]KAJ5058504.1 hypothetical protein J3E74DRAFT_221465 [Bipolaris maydis]
MSQSSTPFDGVTEDPFLSSSNQDQFFKADFEELFGSSGSDGAIFSSNNSEVFDGTDFAYGDVSRLPADSSSSSVISTPEPSNHSSNRHSSAYPTPEADKPHPHPLKTYQPYETSIPQPVFNSRPFPIKSQTNNVQLYSAQLVQPGSRRRSLSHGDMDRVVAASIPNPTFIRLQAPRARTIPEELRGRDLHSHCGRGSCQSPPTRDRLTKPTSMPYSLQSSPLVGGMLPTPIGTPLNVMENTDFDTNTTHQDHIIENNNPFFPSFPEGPLFRQMLRPEELERSRQIIEIGALAVTSHGSIDPMLQPYTSVSNQERILKKLIDIEEHLGKSGGAEALRSCRTIREALIGKTECEEEAKGVDRVLEHDGNTAINTPKEAYSNLSNGYDDNEIMAMLMSQHGGREGENGE